MEQDKNFPQKEEQEKKHGDSSEDPENEGHVKEWQDRARVVLNAKEAVHDSASPRQSPSGEQIEDTKEKEDTASY